MKLEPRMSASDAQRISARLKRDFQRARKAFWTEYEFGLAELTRERTLY
jgi:hypothetical protein